MSAHEMVCHLTDAFLMGTATKPVSAVTGWHYRTVVKWVALYVPLPWPPGIPTRPELDQRIGGTKPGDFQRDLAALQAIVERLSPEGDFFRGRAHPLFGPLPDAGWMRWAYLHMNHHLRQFGL